MGKCPACTRDVSIIPVYREKCDFKILLRFQLPFRASETGKGDQSMVNELQRIKDRVVKVEIAPAGERAITARAGHALLQSAARKARFVSQARRRLLPARKEPSQGFTTASVALALAHGLLSGGRGFSATESLREETPLLKLLGLDRAPSAETVEQVVKYIAEEAGGREATVPFLQAQVLHAIRGMSHRRLRGPGGFVYLFVDGSLLEVSGKRFDSIKTIQGKSGRQCVAAYVGPWPAACEFSREGEGEETVGRRLFAETLERVLRPAHAGRARFALRRRADARAARGGARRALRRRGQRADSRSGTDAGIGRRVLAPGARSRRGAGRPDVAALRGLGEATPAGLPALARTGRAVLAPLGRLDRPAGR